MAVTAVRRSEGGPKRSAFSIESLVGKDDTSSDGETARKRSRPWESTPTAAVSPGNRIGECSIQRVLPSEPSIAKDYAEGSISDKRAQSPAALGIGCGGADSSFRRVDTQRTHTERTETSHRKRLPTDETSSPGSVATRHDTPSWRLPSNSMGVGSANVAAATALKNIYQASDVYAPFRMDAIHARFYNQIPGISPTGIAFPSPAAPAPVPAQRMHPMLIGHGRDLTPLYPWLMPTRYDAYFHSRLAGAEASLLLQPFRKAKRIRTAFSPSQLLRLEHAFEKNHYVVGQERKTLASSLSLTETQVKVWFQNRRTKFKRMKAEEVDGGAGVVYDDNIDVMSTDETDEVAEESSEDEDQTTTSPEKAATTTLASTNSHHLNRWRANMQQVLYSNNQDNT